MTTEPGGFRGLGGSTAIVTGGATLIGQAVVRAFHDQGAAVAVADIDAGRGRALADELGDRVFFSETDLRDDTQVQRFVGAARERFGRLDFLVNLACSYVDDGATDDHLAQTIQREAPPRNGRTITMKHHDQPG